MSLLAVPAGGTWQFCDAPAYCMVCERFVPQAWRYFTGALSHAAVCQSCAEYDIKEENDAARGGPSTSR